MEYPAAFAGTWSVERGGEASMYTGCDVARGCTLPLRACGIGRVCVCGLRPRDLTLYCCRHSPCFIWVFRVGPRSVQAGHEMRGGVPGIRLRFMSEPGPTCL